MKLDAIELELFRHLRVSISEEMGAVLRRTSYSANIKERRDDSCAVYDAAGETVAMGDHMPVHLGAMPLAERRGDRPADPPGLGRAGQPRGRRRHHSRVRTAGVRGGANSLVRRGRSTALPGKTVIGEERDSGRRLRRGFSEESDREFG